MADELVRLLQELVRARAKPAANAPPGGRAASPAAPIAVSDALLQERLRAVETDLAEVRARVNGLIFLVIGTVLGQLVLRMLG